MTSFETIAEQGQLAAVTEFVRKGARDASFNENDMLPVDLIVEEIFLNIAVHGYKDRPPGPVAIHCDSATVGMLTIRFQDWAEEFNPLAADNNPDHQVPLSQRRIGGLGLVAVKSIAESITYQRIENTNDLTIRLIKQP
jgi:serine/threonine-protein kinase RsbW